MGEYRITSLELSVINSLLFIAKEILKEDADFQDNDLEITAFAYGLLTNNTLKNGGWIRVSQGTLQVVIEGDIVSLSLSTVKEYLLNSLEKKGVAV